MLQTVIKKILTATAFNLVVAYSYGQSTYMPPVFKDSERASQVQAAFPLINSMYQDYAQKHHFPGYVFAIIVDGQVVSMGQGGYAFQQKKIPVDSHTMFRIASMTKSFTAMAILKLRDEGKLKLDDPVSLYIPELKNQKLTQDSPEITIRDLLTHAAGFPEDNPWGDRNLDKTDEELIALLKKGISFSNATGLNYEYSNLGFALLGLVIKKVSGIPYQKYITTHIWQPLGINEAAWEYTKVPGTQLAHGYQWDNGTWKEEKLLHDGSFGAMGGIIMSMASFSRYVALHQAAWPPRDDAESHLIRRSSIREMHQPWRFNTFNAQAKLNDQRCATISAYGYGLRWLRDCHSIVYIGHSGGLPGFGSNWVILPEYGIGAVLFANVTYAPADAINLNVINTLIKQAHLQPRQLPPSTPLEEKKEALMELLPDWQNVPATGVFAANFFQDNPIESLRKKTQTLFAMAGKIIKVGELIPENQLRGYFILEGENMDLKISFTLSPENPALIQSYQIEETKIKDKMFA